MTEVIDQREKVTKLIKEKTNLQDDYVKDVEIGIYNWCIDYCDSKKIFKSWKNPRFSMLYVEKARSILSNLDPISYIKNTQLLKRVVDNELMPHEVAFLKANEMFPEKWKETVDELFKKFEYAYENRVEANTQEYRCSRCKQKKCVYFTLQTRSSDEPETIFIRCLECGHGWKM